MRFEKHSEWRRKIGARRWLIYNPGRYRIAGPGIYGVIRRFRSPEERGAIVSKEGCIELENANIDRWTVMLRVYERYGNNEFTTF